MGGSTAWSALGWHGRQNSLSSESHDESDSGAVRSELCTYTGPLMLRDWKSEDVWWYLEEIILFTELDF